ncbi:MAG TPA: type III-A CRISPR-associated RAMP protein Csm4 [Clostridia bacterium]
MKNYLIKLKFLTSVHFGNDQATPDKSLSAETIHADTFYSAMLIESLRNGGIEQLEKINQIFKNGALISDLMPYYEDDYFIPKPIMNIEVNSQENIDRKLFKNLKYINIKNLKNYLGMHQEGLTTYDPKSDLETIEKIGKASIRAQLQIEEPFGNYQNRLLDPRPFFYGTYTFSQNSGLYLILRIHEKDFDQIFSLISTLGFSGIGGKTSSGLGKYAVQKCILINENQELEMFEQHFDLKNFSSYMTLTVCFPKKDELNRVQKNASYMLLKRSGFIQSSTYSDTLQKKRDMFVFSQGSVFDEIFEGDIFDVSNGGNHKVYRYLKPFLIGVQNYELLQN